MGEEKKDRSDGSRDVRVGSTTTSRDVRVGVSLAALIRGHRRLRHRRTTLHFFYPDRLYCGRYKTYCFSTLHSCTHCTGAADIVQFYTSSTQVRQSTIAGKSTGNTIVFVHYFIACDIVQIYTTHHQK